MNKLLPIFEKLENRISFTLDNELFNHPNAVEILHYVKKIVLKIIIIMEVQPELHF